VLLPFFALAAQSPTRQLAFRRLVVAHLLLLGAAVYALSRQRPGQPATLLGHLLLVAGIVEGALLVGWRLTQLPRSRALEFLLVSPLRPRALFLGEALVGLAQLALVTLAGLPVLLVLAAGAALDPLDTVPLVLMPLTWGALTGLGLTAWAYEPRVVRRWGERLALALVLLYLVVGVLAGERLGRWLGFLPDDARIALLQALAAFHAHNPFGTLRFWLENDLALGWRRALALEAGAVAALGLLLARGACCLEAHFHERHYEPVRDVSGERRPPLGDRPLSWWAVKRVSEYSGRINLWLAGGFSLLYALYLVAGDRWPAWMGRTAFQMCDAVGGAPGLSTALVVLAAVPAAFQYGLWDSSTQDRCRRLELLLLTGLGPRDYWGAAASAAWVRGRGYFGAALLLWAASLVAGRLSAAQFAAAAATGVLLWALYFALGFRAFARGAQANGLGMLLTVGLPLAAFTLTRLGWPLPGSWLPPGAVYRAGAGPASPAWLVGPVLVAGLALVVARRSLARCDAQLRRWYDENCGRKALT
jgi:hypothetical protein